MYVDIGYPKPSKTIPKETFISKLPQNVVKDGVLVQIRDEIKELVQVFI
jgi:hypothetical protein